MKSSILTAVMAVAIVACGTVPSGGSGAPIPVPTTTTTENTTPTLENGSPRVELAIGDLAEHLDIDPSSIELVSEEDVSWSDGSVGCPEPGMAYTQAIVPGYLIILQADGTEYRYHGATDEDPWRCDRMPLNPVRP